MITDGIARVTPDGIVTVDGTERPVDVIVLATGFHVTDSYTYVDIKGAHGEDLVDRWNREGMVAHRGITVADMPNLFFLLGPNTGLGHNSVVFMIESQIHYVARRDRRGGQVRCAGAGAQPAPLRIGTTRSCRATCRPRSGTPAVAGAGTSTSTGSTARCGAVWRRQYWLATRSF